MVHVHQRYTHKKRNGGCVPRTSQKKRSVIPWPPLFVPLFGKAHRQFFFVFLGGKEIHVLQLHHEHSLFACQANDAAREKLEICKHVYSKRESYHHSLEYILILKRTKSFQQEKRVLSIFRLIRLSRNIFISGNMSMLLETCRSLSKVVETSPRAAAIAIPAD